MKGSSCSSLNHCLCDPPPPPPPALSAYAMPNVFIGNRPFLCVGYGGALGARGTWGMVKKGGWGGVGTGGRRGWGRGL